MVETLTFGDGGSNEVTVVGESVTLEGGSVGTDIDGWIR